MVPGSQQRAAQTVTVAGGGVAGMSAACALAEAGFRVRLVERRGYLGGRASSYLHPGVNEVIDNCQHVLFGCCTNLLGFYRRIGVADRIHWTSEMMMIEPGSCRRTVLGPSAMGPLTLPAPFHAFPKLLAARAFTAGDKLSLARALGALMRPLPADCAESLGAWLERSRQTPGAINRFWRLVIASALNADLDSIALPYAAKVVRELFMNSAEAGRMGMSTVPLSELYAGAEQFLKDRGSEVLFNTNIEAAEWDQQTSQWTLITRTGTVISDFLVFALPFGYLELLVSASRSFAALSREQAIAQSVAELKEFFPAAAAAKLEKAALVKEVRATFGVPPGIDGARPPTAAPWPNCFLAGDWIATGWPSTMESAARSGHLAAEAVSAAAGSPRRFLNPDMKPQGLMRWVKTASRG